MRLLNRGRQFCHNKDKHRQYSHNKRQQIPIKHSKIKTQ